MREWVLLVGFSCFWMGGVYAVMVAIFMLFFNTKAWIGSSVALTGCQTCG